TQKMLSFVLCRRLLFVLTRRPIRLSRSSLAAASAGPRLYVKRSSSPIVRHAQRSYEPRPRTLPAIQMILPRFGPSARRWTRSVRGDVYRLRAPKNVRGHEQRGSRHAVVLQADVLCALSTWLVAP